MQSKILKGVLIGLGVLAISLIILQAGMFVGFRKASFSYGLGDNFRPTFGGRYRGDFVGMPHGGFVNAHGASGKIISVSGSTFILEDDDNVEKIVSMTTSTAVMRFRNAVPTTELKVGDFVVVIGAPDDQAQLEARLIRIMPGPAPDLL